MKRNDVPLSRAEEYDDLAKSDESEEGEGYPPEDLIVNEEVKKPKFNICGCCKNVTCLLLISIFIFLFSSFVFGYGIAELNAAEFFVPYFDGGKGYKSTVIFHHEGKNKTCNHMKKSFFKDCIPMRSITLWNLCVSFYAIGGLVGAFAAGPISNLPFLGRKWTLWISSVLFIISCCLKCVFSSFWTLLFGRILHGLASGMATTVVPMYISEVTPKNVQGTFGTFNQFGITFGIFVSQLISIFTVKAQWWRLLLGWTASLACIQVMTLPFVPSSPKYLIGQNRIKSAKKSLLRLRHSDEEGIKEEFEILLRSVKKKKKDEVKTKKTIKDDDGSINLRTDEDGDVEVESKEKEEEDKEPFRMKIFSCRTLYHLTIAMMMQVIQQLSGINAIMFYSTKVYTTIFPKGSAPTVLSAITMFVNMISVVPALIFVEILGRKWLLMIGITMEVITMCGVTVFQVIMVYVFHGKGAGSATFGVFTIMSVMVYIFFFEASLGPIPWFIISELFTTNLRPYAQGIACAMNWLSMFLVGIIFPYMQDGMNMFCFLVFVFFMILAWIFTFFCLMETKGKEVKEVCETSYFRTIFFCEVPTCISRLFGKKNDEKFKESLITKKKIITQ